jgi:sugar phosphate isomerase/epimerase
METIISQAVAMGFDGVDFRGFGQELAIYNLAEFSSKARDTSLRFQDSGLEISCFSCSAKAFNPTIEAKHSSIEEVRAYAPLCETFGTRYIRVFGGAIGDTPQTQAVDSAARTLEEMAKIAANYNARITVETHDDWIDSELLRRLMGEIHGDIASVLWDVHHPYRMNREPPELTWLNLGRFVEYTHWKDSKADPSKPSGYTYTHFGEGDLPLSMMVNLLANAEYDGWLTYEWEKRWHPELPEPEEAFPIFVDQMKRLIAGAD